MAKMIFKDEPKKPKYKIESGVVDAVCYSFQDLGIQSEKDFNDPTKQIQRHKVAFGFEIDQLIEDEDNLEYNGKRLTQWVIYTWSWFEKSNLARQYLSWFGKIPTKEELAEGIDLEELCVRKTCSLNLIEKGPYVNIDAIMKPTKRNEMKPGIGPKPPSWIQLKIDSAIIEEQEPIEEDDLPF